MSTFSPPMNLSDMTIEMHQKNYKPILAHPERYSFYFDNFEKFKELKESGFLFQLNLLSVSGYYGSKVQKMALKLLSRGYYDFAGSDIHNRIQLETLEKGFLSKHTLDIQALMKKNGIFK